MKKITMNSKAHWRILCDGIHSRLSVKCKM